MQIHIYYSLLLYLSLCVKYLVTQLLKCRTPILTFLNCHVYYAFSIWCRRSMQVLTNLLMHIQRMFLFYTIKIENVVLSFLYKLYGSQQLMVTICNCFLRICLYLLISCGVHQFSCLQFRKKIGVVTTKQDLDCTVLVTCEKCLQILVIFL